MKLVVILFAALALAGCASGGTGDDNNGTGDTAIPTADTVGADAAGTTDTAVVGDTAVVEDTVGAQDTFAAADTNLPKSDVGVTPVSGNAVGQICDESTACPLDYTCLSQAGATKGMCSRPCTPGETTDDCADNYTGPGFPNCFMGVEDASGAVATFCGIVCAMPDVPELTGECPVGMTCTAPLQDASGADVATGCVVAP